MLVNDIDRTVSGTNAIPLPLPLTINRHFLAPDTDRFPLHMSLDLGVAVLNLSAVARHTVAEAASLVATLPRADRVVEVAVSIVELLILLGVVAASLAVPIPTSQS